MIQRGEEFIFSAFRNRSYALLFINSTVTSIILHYRTCYFFKSYSRDTKGLSVANGSSILLKFANILQLENYYSSSSLRISGQGKTVFSVTIFENRSDRADVLIDRNIKLVPNQTNA